MASKVFPPARPFLKVLKELGASDVEPAAATVLLELQHLLTRELLGDCAALAVHAGRKHVDEADVRLAGELACETRAALPLLSDLGRKAAVVNKIPLPAIPKRDADKYNILFLPPCQFDGEEYDLELATVAVGSKTTKKRERERVAATGVVSRKPKRRRL